jgi:hypothetical protein
MDTMTVRKTIRNWWDKEAKIEIHILVADTADDLFRHYFKEYDNRNKYANSVRLQIIDPDMAEAYKNWLMDVNNYANAGGDMW